MQKKIYNLLVFLAIIIIASACNNSRGISVTKRHYSKGNYVSVNKGIKSKTHKLNNDSLLLSKEKLSINSNKKEEIAIELFPCFHSYLV
jgi:hypothetical protein